jgi:hypothetical protein
MKTSFDFDQNVKQIESLRNAKHKTAHNQNLLEKRRKIAQKKINDLRRFANANPDSRVAEICRNRANSMEEMLK